MDYVHHNAHHLNSISRTVNWFWYCNFNYSSKFHDWVESYEHQHTVAVVTINVTVASYLCQIWPSYIYRTQMNLVNASVGMCLNKGIILPSPFVDIYFRSLSRVQYWLFFFRHLVLDRPHDRDQTDHVTMNVSCTRKWMNVIKINQEDIPIIHCINEALKCKTQCPESGKGLQILIQRLQPP